MKTSEVYGITIADDPAAWRWFAEHFAGNYYSMLEQEQQKEQRATRLAVDIPTANRILLAKNVKQYYITERVAKICALNSFPKGIDYRWLSLVNDGIRQFNYGDHLFRWEKLGNQFTIFYSRRFVPGTNPVYPKNNQYHNFLMLDMVSKTSYVYGDPVALEAHRLFYQFICYVELNDITEIVVPGRTKHGNWKKPDGLYNQTAHDIIMVDTRWNTTIKVKKDIPVSGHWRNQPIGPRGGGLTKPTWIEEYHKTGYTLKARKLNEGNK